MTTTKGTDATGNLRWTIEKDYSHLDVDLVGEFDEGTADDFDRAIRNLSVGRRREYSINVVGLSFVDSAFLRVMVGLHEDHGFVAILNPSTKLAETLAAAGLDEVFVVRNDHRSRDRA